MQKPIFIIGLPGVGKSTLVRQLSADLNISFVDLDNYIEETQEQSITDIIKAGGEDIFRKVETHALKSYTQLNKQFIMACGGGTPCFNSNMEFMNKAGITVYYTQPVDVVVSRLQNDPNTRPLLKDAMLANLTQQMHSLLQKREPFYLKANIISDSNEGILQAISQFGYAPSAVF